MKAKKTLDEAPGTVCQAGYAEAEVERNAKKHAKRKLRKRKLLDLGANMRQKGHDIYANNEAYTERLHIRLQEVEAMVPPHLLEKYENINGVQVQGYWLRPTNFVSSPQRRWTLLAYRRKGECCMYLARIPPLDPPTHVTCLKV
jgi:hypothetical protein